jgi:hypothetical protein
MLPAAVLLRGSFCALRSVPRNGAIYHILPAIHSELRREPPPPPSSLLRERPPPRFFAAATTSPNSCCPSTTTAGPIAVVLLALLWPHNTGRIPHHRRPRFGRRQTVSSGFHHTGGSHCHTKKLVCINILEDYFPLFLFFSPHCLLLPLRRWTRLVVLAERYSRM